MSGAAPPGAPRIARATVRGARTRPGTLRCVRARGAAACCSLQLSALAACWPACRAPCARAVSCEAENGASGARSSSTARAARRGRPCPTSSGRSWHSSYAASAVVSDGRASTYDAPHTSAVGCGEEPRRWVGSRKPPRRASELSALLRYCANVARRAQPHPTPPHPTPPGGSQGAAIHCKTAETRTTA